jgi:hypothetical protein
MYSSYGPAESVGLVGQGTTFITGANTGTNQIAAYVAAGYGESGPGIQLKINSNSMDSSRIFLTNTKTVGGTSISDCGVKITSSVGLDGDLFIRGIMKLYPLGTAPSDPTAGMFAVANRTGWDPASKGSGNAYPVFYDGATWIALY